MLEVTGDEMNLDGNGVYSSGSYEYQHYSGNIGVASPPTPPPFTNAVVLWGRTMNIDADDENVW